MKAVSAPSQGCLLKGPLRDAEIEEQATEAVEERA
jgi:hypothetical protein